MNRGFLHFVVALVAGIVRGQDDLCELAWSTPNGCTSDADCIFQSFLRYDSDTINIELRSANGRNDATPTGLKWVGIGFSLDNIMPNSDCLMGWVEDDGSFEIFDRWAEVRAMPETDQAQGGTDDLDDKEGEFIDGITVLRFSRARNTGDNFDIPITDNQELFIFHVFDGGDVFDLDTGEIGYHGASGPHIFIQQIASFPPCAQTDLPVDEPDPQATDPPVQTTTRCPNFLSPRPRPGSPGGGRGGSGRRGRGIDQTTNCQSLPPAFRPRRPGGRRGGGRTRGRG